MRQLILDTETTGLSALGGDRLIEFAALEMVDRHLTGKQMHFYVNPERDIPEEAVRIHGITADQLRDKPLFAEVGRDIADFLRGAELIIHNAPFDIGFLNMEFARMGLPEIDDIVHGVVDTLLMAKQAHPGKKNSLDALCTRFDIDRSQRVLHGALIDCALLADVYLAMTRTQFNLEMDQEYFEQENVSGSLHHSSLQARSFKVLRASDDELKAHEVYLDNLSREGQKNILYRDENKDDLCQ